jgi:hypothetical protein
MIMYLMLSMLIVIFLIFLVHHELLLQLTKVYRIMLDYELLIDCRTAHLTVHRRCILLITVVREDKVVLVQS